jgi:hypothetical protein
MYAVFWLYYIVVIKSCFSNIAFTDSYEKAYQKMQEAELTSDLQTDAEASVQKLRPNRLVKCCCVVD